MSLDEGLMLELMAYVDGELDEGARVRVEKLLATSQAAKDFVASLRLTGAFAKAGIEHHASECAGDIADAVMSRISSEPAVVSLDDARAKRATKVLVGGIFATGLAAAAAVALLVYMATRLPKSGTSAGLHGPAVAPSGEASPIGGGAMLGALSAGVNVENVQATSQVSVFYLPAVEAADASSVVVWIDDEAKDSGVEP